jgi:hypothetical protein
MAETVHLRYGQAGLDVRLPSHARPTLVGKRPLAKLRDGRSAVLEALAKPVGSRPYREIVQGRTSACILICDITRPVPNGLFLRPLIEGLLDAGIPKERITVLIATGLHRPNEGAELAEVVGDPWVFETVRVENHFARDDAAHVDFGFTRTRRTPVRLDRRFVEADVRIATGLVEPHFMAGYSGGRKVIAPGVAHADTIRTFHSARFMEDPLAIQCNLEGNPLHEEQLEIVRMLGEVYVNTVIDDDRDLVRLRRNHREPRRSRLCRSSRNRASFRDRPDIGPGHRRQDVPDGQGLVTGRFCSRAALIVASACLSWLERVPRRTGAAWVGRVLQSLLAAVCRRRRWQTS